MTLSCGKMWGLRRLADAQGRFKMVAVDQRPPIKGPIAAHYGTEQAPWADVARFKRLLVQSLQEQASAMLLDPHYALPAAIDDYHPARGLILTLEDSVFQETPEGRLSSSIDDWSVEKIKRCGGDAVKVLAWYRPDTDQKICQAQQAYVRHIGEQCRQYDLPFVFELLLYPLARETEGGLGYQEMRAKRPELVIESVRAFAGEEFGVDVFKLESPLPAADVPGVGGEAWADAQRWFDDLGAAAGRPWVMLSAGASAQDFGRVLSHAYRAGASGYLAGRAIWADAFKRFPDWDAIELALHQDARTYMTQLNELTDAQATPWPTQVANPVPAEPRDGSFRQRYAAMTGGQR